MTTRKFRIAERELKGLVWACRNRSHLDFHIVISFPESPSQGGHPTKLCQEGLPEVFVEITAPQEHEAELQRLVSRLSMLHALLT